MELCAHHEESEEVIFRDYVVATRNGEFVNIWEGDWYRPFPEGTFQWRIGLACCKEDAKYRALSLAKAFSKESN